MPPNGTAKPPFDPYVYVACCVAGMAVFIFVILCVLLSVADFDHHAFRFLEVKQ